jgi:hypothetical protein
MSTADSIPCIQLPNPKPLKISLPFGADLKSVVDLSKGPPSDCTLIHGLMLQLAPALAGLECILNMLAVFSALANMKQPGDIMDVVKKAKKMADCFLFPAKILCMILDILKLIIAYLKCIIEAVESLLKFQVGIDFNAANGNPVLLASLNCAQNNATASMAQIKQALELIQPLLTVVKPIADLAASPLPGPVQDTLKIIPEVVATLKSVLDGGGAAAGVPGTKDAVKTLDEIRNTLTNIQQVLDSVPC